DRGLVSGSSAVVGRAARAPRFSPRPATAGAGFDGGAVRGRRTRWIARVAAVLHAGRFGPVLARQSEPAERARGEHRSAGVARLDPPEHLAAGETIPRL